MNAAWAGYLVVQLTRLVAQPLCRFSKIVVETCETITVNLFVGFELCSCQRHGSGSLPALTLGTQYEFWYDFSTLDRPKFSVIGYRVGRKLVLLEKLFFPAILP